MSIKINVDNLKRNSSTLSIVTLPKTAEALLDKHFQEWVLSGVDEEIIKLNVFSIAGKDAVIEHLNLGSLNPWQLQHKYKNIFSGGWICGHLFKPDQPRQVKNKVVKYETQLNGGSEPILLKLPERIWQAIAAKHDIAKPLDIDGWEWVKQNPQIPVPICEGVKKAACIISQTLTPAIALPGHSTAYEKDGDLRFSEFVHPDRQIIICFDHEQKIPAAKSVARTIKGIGWRLNPKNEKPRAKLSICRWWLPEKGIDDVWSEHGQAETMSIINNAVPWSKWVDTSYSLLGYEPNVQFNSPRWQPTEIPKNRQLIILKGAKGTGKTWQLEQLTKEAKERKQPSIAVTHRIQLSQALANRLGLTYISELDEKVEGAKNISLCIDSLSKINPTNFSGGLIIFDEIVQVLEHFLIGDTCIYKRQKILFKLKELMQVIIESGGKVVIADADLDHKTINFLIGLMGETQPFIIENTYREPSYKCIISAGYEASAGKRIIKTPADVVGVALQKALNGERVFIACSGQKEESKWGSNSLEGLFLKYEISSLVRIDSDTIKDPHHPAFRATGKINELCDTHQVIIATPSLGTGVSIENNKSFDLICGIFTGVGNPDAARQFLMRVRDKSVPRLIYAAERGLNDQFINLGYNEKQVSERIKDLREFQQNCLTDHDSQWSEEYPEIKHCNTSSVYFNNLIAEKNYQNGIFKNFIREGLLGENITITEVDIASEVFETEIDFQNIFEEVGTISSDNVAEYRAKLEAQELLEKEEYEKLKAATELTKEDRVALEATLLSNKYGGIPVTEELIAKDKENWYDKIKLHYACTVGFEIQKNIQALIANTQIRKGEGKIIEHDFVQRQALLSQSEFINASEIISLIESQHIFSKADEESVSLYQDMVEQVPNINLIFNQQIKSNQYKPDKFNFKLIEQIGSLIGGESVDKGRPATKNGRTRQYQINIPKDGRKEIFEKWLEKDKETEIKWFSRKKDWEIRKLISTVSDEMSISEYLELKKHALFNEIWEHTDTTTRIKLINRVDGFTLPTPIIEQLDPSSDNYQTILTNIKNWTEISLDIETYGNDPKNKNGLHARNGFIRLIQISNGVTNYYADLGKRNDDRDAIQKSLSEFLSLLNNLISDPNVKIIGQNIHFDLRFLRFQLGFDRARNVADTMKGAQIFFGDYGGLGVLPGGYGLGNLSAKLLGLDVDKTEQKSDWGASLTQSQIDYAIRDPFVTYWLYKRLLELYNNPNLFGFGKLAQDGLMDAWQLENDVIPCAVEIENNGVPINRTEAKNLLDRCQTIQNQLIVEWQKLVATVNYTQNSRLKTLLNEKYNLHIKSLNKAKIADLSDLPEIKLLSKLRAIKIPIQQLESLLRSSERSGRIETVFNTLTGTGRFSSGNSKQFKDLPNLQSISAKAHPALKEFNLPSIRTIIKPDDNEKYLLVDKESTLKAQAKYQKLNKGVPEIERDYLKMCQEFFDIILNLDTLNFINKIEAIQHLKSWRDDKQFIKKYDLPELKNLVKSLSNRTVAVIDLAGSHGRIAANVANDETAIAGNNDASIDNHSKVAVYVAKALNQDVTWEEIKQGAKSGNANFKLFRDTAKNTYYGWLNGAGAKRIQEQIKSNSGQIVALEACEAAIKGCEALYPQVVEFRKNLVANLSNKDNLLHIDGKHYAVNKIDAVNNRITHLVTINDDKVDLPYTQCLAAIWSRTEATALKRALVQITGLADTQPKWGLKVINYVHDEINIEFNTEHAEIIVTTVNNIIGDCFQATMDKVKDGRETNWTKLIVENWSQK